MARRRDLARSLMAPATTVAKEDIRERTAGCWKRMHLRDLMGGLHLMILKLVAQVLSTV